MAVSKSLKERRKSIMNLSYELGLPDAVRATAIYIFNETHEIFGQNIHDEHIYNMAILSVASKSEEFHGFNKRIPIESYKYVIKFERQLHDLIDYEYKFPAPFYKIGAILLLIQQRDLINPNSGFFRLNSEERASLSIRNMNILLLECDNLKDVVELVYAAIDIPYDALGNFPYRCNLDNVLMYKEIIRNAYVN
ncbi:hypothetical protein P3W45_000627 [Vairimorpha bombi]|jgi:hypothetical protein